VNAQTIHSCGAGLSACHIGRLLSAGRMSSRLSSCIGYMATSTVAATFHEGGGGETGWGAPAHTQKQRNKALTFAHAQRIL